LKKKSYGGEFTNNVDRTQDYETFVEVIKGENKRTQNKRFRNSELFSTSEFAVRWFFIPNLIVLRKAAEPKTE
jgi:hypothetical protein